MTDSKKVDCKYWDKCYQKNPSHHSKYNHPPKLQVEPPRKRSPSPKLLGDAKRAKNTPSPSESDEEMQKKEDKPSDKPKEEKMMSQGSSEDEEGLVVDAKQSDERRSPSWKSNPDDDTDDGSQSPVAGGSSTGKETASNSSDSKAEAQPKQSRQEVLKEAAERKEMDITKEYNEVMENLSKSNYFEIFQRRVRYSKKAEYQDLLKTPEFMRHKFLVEMPPDFFKFWEFCESIAREGQQPEKVFNKLGLKLVGPFDYLAGNFHDAKIQEPGDYLRHWRFYYDPPEFQTIFVKDKSGIHYGYWRDDPKEKENLLMARNDVNKGCEFDFVGGNCFETVLYFLEKDVNVTPFIKVEVNNMKKAVQAFAELHKIELDSLPKLKKERNSRVVCKTFHKAGLVVDYDKKTQLGYRNLIDSDANIKKIIAKFQAAKGNETMIAAAMEELQPLITAANIATDECDFGTGIELGIDLFCSGCPELHEVLSTLLITGYSLLKRPQYIAIMKAHLEGRKKGTNLSIFDN